MSDTRASLNSMYGTLAELKKLIKHIDALDSGTSWECAFDLDKLRAIHTKLGKTLDALTLAISQRESNG